MARANQLLKRKLIPYRGKPLTPSISYARLKQVEAWLMEKRISVLLTMNKNIDDVSVVAVTQGISKQERIIKQT